jgi:hypothetical protein
MKKYITASMTEEQIRKILETTNPKGMIKEFMSFEHTPLGRKIIDGMEAEGIEVNDPKFGGFLFERAKGCLWVSVETDLPVRIEIEGVSGGVETKVVAYDFDWSAVLEPDVFEPNIPEDYVSHGEIDVSDNEGAAIRGLRMFTELVGGRYPSNLDLMTASQEAAKVVQAKIKDALKLDSNTIMSKEDLEKIANIQATCSFYAKLVKDDKDVAYYGDKVKPEDVNVVLLRWKVSENEYRVIFGDLTAENVSAERLAELESQLPE